MVAPTRMMLASLLFAAMVAASAGALGPQSLLPAPSAAFPAPGRVSGRALAPPRARTHRCRCPSRCAAPAPAFVSNAARGLVYEIWTPASISELLGTSADGVDYETARLFCEIVADGLAVFQDAAVLEAFFPWTDFSFSFPKYNASLSWMALQGSPTGYSWRLPNGTLIPVSWAGERRSTGGPRPVRCARRPAER